MNAAILDIIRHSLVHRLADCIIRLSQLLACSLLIMNHLTFINCLIILNL